MLLSAYDMDRYTKGAARELGLHSQTLQEVSRKYATRRKQFRKSRLRWRKSRGAGRSLGWIPFNSGAAKWKIGQVYHNGHFFKVWDSYGLSNYTFRSGSFSEDARGRWYFNVVVDVEIRPGIGQGAVGIDPGLTEVATCSDGAVLENARFYRGLEARLAAAQRSRNRKRARAIHARIANRRKDALHKFTTALARQYGEIYLGNVSPKHLSQTRMAKSVHDTGWNLMKTLLEYKCAHAGSVFKVVDERYTTRTCSSCGARSGPQGVNGLRTRVWSCSESAVSLTIAISTRPGTYLRPGMAVLRRESPAFRPVRMSIRAAYDGPFGVNRRNLDSLFCSELVALAYQRMGYLGSKHSPNEFTPKDLSDAGGIELLQGRLSEEWLVKQGSLYALPEGLRPEGRSKGSK